MTLAGRVVSWFPAVHLAAVLAAALALATAPSARTLAALGFAVYGLPLVAFRAHARLAPVEQGLSRLDAPGYSAWWGSHQFQLLFLAVPALEAVLRLVPGLFSAWLRGWGSRVGRGVHWTPGLEVADRGLLDIGDRVVFGHRVGLYSHVVARKRGRLLLYTRRVRIGADVFVGAGSRIGPGVHIEPGTSVTILSDLFPNRHLRDVDDETRRPAHAGSWPGRARPDRAASPGAPPESPALRA